MNGIIKTEKLYRMPLYGSMRDAKRGIGSFIAFYNDRRPHMNINYQTIFPDVVGLAMSVNM